MPVHHKPSTDADVTHPTRQPVPPRVPVVLTPAQSHAERRSAPLTPEQFRSLRQLAEQGVNPLRHL
jgi:hypothetical protein